tara:strand:- start:1338 stop:1550 length:213 start_codon:yes stop_codon:yes gene_type:complete
MTQQEESLEAIKDILDSLPESMSNVDMITLFVAIADAYAVSVPDLVMVTGEAAGMYYEHIHGAEVKGAIH